MTIVVNTRADAWVNIADSSNQDDSPCNQVAIA